MYKVVKNENKKIPAILTMSNGEKILHVVRENNNSILFISPDGFPVFDVSEEVIKETAKAIGIKIIPDEPVMQIKYIGKRDKQKDAIYNTGWWDNGQVKKVPFGVAVKMLKHPDVYAKESNINIVESAPVVVETKTEPQEEALTQELRDTVATMDKEQLRKFVAINFAGYKLPTNIGLENARAKTIQMIDLYGVPT